jgi:hypothetical protein
MPDEVNVIPPSRFLRWVLLAMLLAGGIVLFFRHGTQLPAFGSGSSAAADSTR